MEYGALGVQAMEYEYKEFVGFGHKCIYIKNKS
jgi:hypothetical protein